MHTTVLCEEAVTALITTRSGNYVDGTYGRGGHTAAILDRLDEGGRLLAVDRDPAAVADARARVVDPRFCIYQGAFTRLPVWLAEKGWLGAVDGLLLDLGVSSPQLDQAERGFSFQQDGPLDMRMNPEQGMTAAEWLATVPEAELAGVLREWGEERHARRIARAIVNERERAPIATTGRLAALVKAACPAYERGKHPATRTFQAIRIRINEELTELRQVLDDSLDMLRVGGRLVVISFHSLEDRMVKRFMRQHVRGQTLPRRLPVTAGATGQRLRLVGKPVRASGAEVSRNPRARSAMLRVAEKVA